MDTANTGNTQTVVQPLVDDVIQAEKEVQAIIAAYKAKGATGVASLLPSLAPEIEKDYNDVKAALPMIKTGYKTTEFWIVVGVCGFIGFLTTQGKVPAVDGTTIIGALSGVYAVIRGLIKK